MLIGASRTMTGILEKSGQGALRLAPRTNTAQVNGSCCIHVSMLTTLAVANYRSLRDLTAPLAKLNIVTGPNGSGKSSLHAGLENLRSPPK
jgi:excinuclease UvrABC ATPase subunit